MFNIPLLCVGAKVPTLFIMYMICETRMSSSHALQCLWADDTAVIGGSALFVESWRLLMLLHCTRPPGFVSHGWMMIIIIVLRPATDHILFHSMFNTTNTLGGVFTLESVSRYYENHRHYNGNVEREAFFTFRQYLGSSSTQAAAVPLINNL